jgi:hypothetical protein
MPIAIARATTARELAEILMTYGDLKIRAQVVDVCDGDEVACAVSDEGASLEIHTTADGHRFLAVTGFREGC